MVNVKDTTPAVFEEFVKDCLPGEIRDFVIVDVRESSIIILTDPRKDPRFIRNKRSFFCELYEGITSFDREVLLAGFGLIVVEQAQVRFPTKMIADRIGGASIWVDPHVKPDRAKEMAAGHFSVGVRGNQLIEVRLNPVN